MLLNVIVLAEGEIGRYWAFVSRLLVAVAAKTRRAGTPGAVYRQLILGMRGCYPLQLDTSSR